METALGSSWQADFTVFIFLKNLRRPSAEQDINMKSESLSKNNPPTHLQPTNTERVQHSQH